jgi:hypothetical protein
MKKIFKLLSVVLLTVVVFSCTEGDNPVDTVLNGTVIGGGSLRTITIVSPTIALGDPAGKFQVTLEVQDAQNGAATDKIDVYASFKDNNAADGNNTKAEKIVKSIPSTAFVAGTREMPFANVTVTTAELKTILGLTDSQFTGGDQFVIRLASVLKDGRVFTRANANSTVIGGAYFSSPFQYNANVVCPITESLAGTHTYVTSNMKAGTAGTPCGSTVSGSVVFGATATSGVYSISDMSFGLQGSVCWNDDPAYSASSSVTWFCNNLVSGGVDKYGDSYIYTITSCSGSKMTINWKNSYNDSGTTVLTRQGGANWPTIFAK